MYTHDFKLEFNDEELNEKLFKEASEFIKQEADKFEKSVFGKIAEDMEHFMYERLENVQQVYFREVTAFLLDEKYSSINSDKKLKLTEWLKGLGFTQEEFRKKIYEENKQDIIEQIQYDSIYELLKNMYERSYFKSWDFKDISTAYPQSQVVKEFLRVLVKQNGSQEYIHELLDSENKKQYERLQELRNKVIEVEDKIEELTTV
jgi:hypothetical protein